jgi:transcriptional regulator with XRE-family HTH domain
MSEDLQAMAERIRSCMKDEKLKQSDIVKTTGVSKSSVSKWLSGKARPTGKYLLRLSQVLNQTEDWILNGDNPCYPGYDDDFNIDYDYENIKDSKDYYNRDYLIKTLNLDPKLPYSIDYLTEIYEDQQWKAFRKAQEEHEKRFELSQEQEEELWEHHQQELLENEMEVKCQNHNTLLELEKILSSGIDNSKFQYTELYLKKPAEIAKLANANLSKTIYYTQEDESMEPIINLGVQCAVDISSINVQDGKFYLIKLGQSYNIRALFHRSDSGLLLHSENERFHDEILLKEDVKNLKIVGQLYSWTNIVPIQRGILDK